MSPSLSLLQSSLWCVLLTFISLDVSSEWNEIGSRCGGRGVFFMLRCALFSRTEITFFCCSCLVCHTNERVLCCSSAVAERSRNFSEIFFRFPFLTCVYVVCGMGKNCQFNFQLVSSTLFQLFFPFFSFPLFQSTGNVTWRFSLHSPARSPISFRYQLHFIWTCAWAHNILSLSLDRWGGKAKSHFQAVFSIRDPNKKEAKLLKLISSFPPRKSRGRQNWAFFFRFAFPFSSLFLSRRLCVLSRPNQIRNKSSRATSESCEKPTFPLALSLIDFPFSSIYRILSSHQRDSHTHDTANCVRRKYLWSGCEWHKISPVDEREREMAETTTEGNGEIINFDE